MDALKRMLPLIRRYPSAAVSVLILLTLVGVSIHTAVTIPLSEALAVWNAHENERNEIPRSALPVWTNLFRRENLPESIFVHTDDFESTTEQINETVRRVTTLLTFDYDYTAFPSEMIFLYKINYGAKRPILKMTWIKPDGSESAAYNGIPGTGEARLTLAPSEFLGESGEGKVQKGEYTLRIQMTAFSEEEVSLDGKIIVFGRVYGLGGTDYMRRDLGVGLLWGTPIALLFGLLAATGTAMLGFGIAAIGSWLGGWVDAAIQRVTEVSMMIPFLPTILIIAFLYSSSIWVLLMFIVALNIFSGQLKS
ncbi:ABC transporter permease, partial [Candidatus Bipolaricaulota bacterium]|nr:ABC transporter permease [Candidatus Bipolaricaulota bacterium]